MSDANAALHSALNSISPLTEEERARADELFSLRRMERGEHFVRAGQIPTTIGFVRSGLLRLYYIGDDGSDFTKSFCSENSFVAAYSALLLCEPSRLYIEALEDSEILTANFADYRSLADDSISWQIINRRIGEQLFIKKERREAELLLDDASTRYRRFLEEYPGLEQRLKQYQVASYLGINPVTLSRIRGQKNR